MEIEIKSYLSYVQAATRTLINKDEESNVGHFGLGVASEYFELIKAIKKNDKINIDEEIGDMSWFLANHLIQYSIPSLTKKDEFTWNRLTEIYFQHNYSLLSVSELKDSLETILDNYIDLCKRHFAYSKKVESYKEKLTNCVLLISECLVGISLHYDIAPSALLKANIAKLFDRYPDKFNSLLA